MMIIQVSTVYVELVLFAVLFNSQETTKAANFKNDKSFQNLFGMMDWYSRSIEYLWFFVHQVVLKTILLFLLITTMEGENIEATKYKCWQVMLEHIKKGVCIIFIYKWMICLSMSI